MDLTDTQQAILQLIAERIESEGAPPSQTEIARAFGFKGVRAAQYHLEALEQAGAIRRIPGQARGIRLVQAPPVEKLAEPGLPDSVLRLPVLGRVVGSALVPRRRVRLYAIGHKRHFRSDLATVLDLLRTGELRPEIAARLPLTDAAKALRMLTDRAVVGKIMLLPTSSRSILAE